MEYENCIEAFDLKLGDVLAARGWKYEDGDTDDDYIAATYIKKVGDFTLSVELESQDEVETVDLYVSFIFWPNWGFEYPKGFDEEEFVEVLVKLLAKEGKLGDTISPAGVIFVLEGLVYPIGDLVSGCDANSNASKEIINDVVSVLAEEIEAFEEKFETRDKQWFIGLVTQAMQKMNVAE